MTDRPPTTIRVPPELSGISVDTKLPDELAKAVELLNQAAASLNAATAKYLEGRSVKGTHMRGVAAALQAIGQATARVYEIAYLHREFDRRQMECFGALP